MTKPEPILVPLTHDHLTEWYGEAGRRFSVKGVAAFLDGSLIAVAGFALSKGNVVAFCHLNEQARPYKHRIHRTALQLMAEAKARHRRILAMCDEREKTAPAWLKRLGFRHEEGSVWVWRTSD